MIDDGAGAREVVLTCLECGRLVAVTEDECHHSWRCGVCAGSPFAQPKREAM